MSDTSPNTASFSSVAASITSRVLKSALAATVLLTAACANSTPPRPRYVQTLLERTPDGRDRVVGYRDDSVISGNSVGVYNLRDAEGREYQVATSGPNALQTVAPVLYGIGSIASGAGFIMNGIAALRLSGQPQSGGGIQLNVAGGTGVGVGTGGKATNRNDIAATGGNAQSSSNQTLTALQEANPQLKASLTANPQLSAMLTANPQMTSNVASLAQANPTLTTNAWTQMLSQVSQHQAQQQQQQQQMPQPQMPQQPPHGGQPPAHGGGWIGSEVMPRSLTPRRVVVSLNARLTNG